MSAQHDLIRDSYAAFNARDLDAALAGMNPDVDWPNAIDGGRLHGHETIRAYWTRQLGMIDPRVEPTGFETDAAGRTVVQVRQVVRNPAGSVISEGVVEHIYQIADGLVTRMDIRK